MKIACVSDLHSPQYFEDFVKTMDSFREKPDLFLIAGDIINRGRIEEFDKFFNVLFGKIFCPIVACFGNNEYPDLRKRLREKHKEVIFLDDESICLEISGIKVGIVGSTGSLDKPTTWQKKNVPDIEKIYEERVKLVDKLLAELKAEFKILLIHYSPTYKTLKGEREFFYPNLGSEK
ncbi:MAG: metallophosphoesterase, partial [Candidatus Aenigmatarchaeota archaeon]